MKLTKERARLPVIENGTLGVGYFSISCHGPWVQGKGHTSSYTMHLSKADALYVIQSWITDLARFEREEAKKVAAAFSATERQGE